MANMKSPRYRRTEQHMTVRDTMFEDELRDSPDDLTHGVPYMSNAHPEQQYMDMTRLLPMAPVVRDRGDGEYEMVTPRPSLSMQTRDMMLNHLGSAPGGMTFHSALEKEKR